MRSIDLYTAVRAVNNDILERSETAFYGQKETGWLKWGAMAACVSLILTVALTTLPGILRGPGGVLPPPNPAPGPTVSELAEAWGWTSEYLEDHFVVVWAKYYVEYDHTKTFLDDGPTEQYFYLAQDVKTGEWAISDNDSPRTRTEP